MLGFVDMQKERDRHHRKLFLGCGGLLATAVVLLLALVAFGLVYDRTAAAYPDSIPLSSHSNYKFPTHYRWDDSYSTQDTISQLYEYYSITFQLGSESKAIGSCTLLEDTKTYFMASRTMSVMLCETKNERLIYVTRSTALMN